MGQLCSFGPHPTSKYAVIDVREVGDPKPVVTTPKTPEKNSVGTNIVSSPALSSSMRKGSFKGNMVKDYSTEIKDLYHIETKKILGTGASSEVVRIKHKVTGIR